MFSISREGNKKKKDQLIIVMHDTWRDVYNINVAIYTRLMSYCMSYKTKIALPLW